MIRIYKAPSIPASLLKLVPPRSSQDIDERLYKGTDVKRQLRQDQYDKCAYCECRLNGDYGHIEHFRPKAGYSIPPSNAIITPGYYWLAYDWSNLLLSCSKCNTSYKANHFALEDESKRDIANKNISKEEPLLINPYVEDPNLHLEFHEHIVAPKVIDGKPSGKGAYTIELLQLNNRADLVDNRRKAWERYDRELQKLAIANALLARGIEVDKGKELLELATVEITNMRSPESEYSAMMH